MKTTVYLIRHGKVHNPQNILYGRASGYRLAGDAMKEIKQSADYLKDKKISKLYSSSLLRARQTADLLNKTINTSRGVSDLLLEIRTSFQGSHNTFLEKIKFDFYFHPQHGKNDETMEDIKNRMITFLQNMHSIHEGKTIAAVSHGDPIMITYAFLKKMHMNLESIRKNYVSYAEVFKIDIHNSNSIEIERVFAPKQ